MTDDQRPSGEDLLARELRERLHRVVAQVQPDPAALPRLRAQVPRRRARHRNLWTGAAAVVLLSAAALPTFQGVQQLDLSGGPVAGPSVAEPSQSSSAMPRPTPSRGGGGDPVRPPAPPLPVVSTSPTGTEPTTLPEVTASGSVGTVPGTPPAAPVQVPGCQPADLGQGSAQVAATDAEGRVYGWFRVVNVSGRACELVGGGQLVADSATVRVTPHTAGGPASGLGEPGAGGPLLLAPTKGYQIRFGWVPDGACPNGESAQPRTVTVAAPGPSPSASPTEAPGPETSPTPVETSSPTPTPSPTPAEPPAVTLTHTPDPGGKPVSATLTNACTGTVYRTNPEPIPTPTS